MTLRRFIDEEKAKYPVIRLCQVLEVSRSGYYAWHDRPESPKAVMDRVITWYIHRSWADSRRTYGSPRVHADLRMRFGVRCSQKRVARLMRAAGLRGAMHRNRATGTTRRDPRRPVSPDLVHRDFHPKEIDRLWVADITQHHTLEGWLYLATVVDACSRRVVGWSMSDRIRAELVVDALNMAVRLRQPSVATIHHSDRGAQYTSILFGKTLGRAGITASMGTVGDALDNAMAESFNATLQTELLDTRPLWTSREELRSAIFQYIGGFYNHRRRHSALGYLSHAQFERRIACQHRNAG